MKKMRLTKIFLCSAVTMMMLAVGVCTLFISTGNKKDTQAASVWYQVDYSAAADGSGAGTASDPIVIKSAATLRDRLKGEGTGVGKPHAGTQGTHFVLGDNIDLFDLTSPGSTLINWSPRVGSTDLHLAAGSVFDGNNYTIKNMRTNDADTNSNNHRGFFNNVSGTVKNVNFENVRVRAGVSNVGAVAGTAQGSGAIFSRVFVHSGEIRSSGASGGTGGIVGNVASRDTVKIEYCINRANIIGSTGHIGGILGRVHAYGVAIVAECANYGNITCSSLSGGTGGNGVGGIVGCSEDDTSTTIEWCYNRGSIDGHAGVFGQSNGSAGVTAVMDCYNDGPLSNTSATVRAGIGTIGGGGVSAVNNWFNQNYTATIDMTNLHAFRTRTNTAAVNADVNGPISRHSFLMHTQEFVTLMNSQLAAKGLGNKYILYPSDHGNPASAKTAQLISLIPHKTTVFRPNGGSGETYYANVLEHRLETPNKINLPLYDEVKEVIGERIGWKFVGWELAKAPFTQYSPGEQVTLVPNEVYNARWQKLLIDISFVAGGELQNNNDGNAITPPQFVIDDAQNLTLNSDVPFTTSTFWMVLRAGVKPENASFSDWVSIGGGIGADSFPFYSLIRGEQAKTFFNNYVDYDYIPESGGAEGKITIRRTDGSTACVVNIDSESSDAGQLNIHLSAAAMQTANLRTQATLPVEGRITALTVNANKHFIFSNIEIYNSANVLQETIAASSFSKPESNIWAFTCPGTNLYSLVYDDNGMRSGFTIKVNFDKVKYDFEIKPALKGKEDDDNELLDGIVTVTENERFVIGESTSIYAIAGKTEAEDGLRFVAWKIWDVLRGEYEYFTLGDTVAEKTFPVDNEWLQRYLIEDKNIPNIGKVQIIAEYTRLFSVIISAQSDANDDTGFGSLDITVIDTTINDATDYDGGLNGTDPIAEGSVIQIRATSAFFYEIGNFIVVSGDAKALVRESVNTATFEVYGNSEIVVTFVQRGFALAFEARDASSGRSITTQAGFGATINEQYYSPGQVIIGSTINKAHQITISSYEFKGFFVHCPILDQQIPLPDDYLITTTVILNNLNSSENFVIIAKYESRAKLSVSVPRSFAGMGEFQLFDDTVDGKLLYDSREHTNKAMVMEFAFGTRLVLVAEAKTFFSFAEYMFAGILVEESEGTMLAFTIETSSAIDLRFNKNIIDITEKLENKGRGTSSIDKDDELKIGSTIELITTAKYGNTLKKWSINGVKIDELIRDNPDSFELVGNRLFIILTPENAAWIKDNGFKLNSLAEFGYTVRFLLMIIIPSVIIPALLIAFLWYFLNLQRKKRFIRKWLLEEKFARKNFNQASLLEDIRAGKDVGGVSKDAVKAALKAEKKKKKEG